MKISKENGKKRPNGAVTYAKVEYHSYLWVYATLHCSGEGNEYCAVPSVHHDDPIGTTTVEEALEVAEKIIRGSVKNGHTSGRAEYKGVLIMWRNAKILENDGLEYDMDMTDEYDKNRKIPIQ
jgi:hypothetical protein